MFVRWFMHWLLRVNKGWEYGGSTIFSLRTLEEKRNCELGVKHKWHKRNKFITSLWVALCLKNSRCSWKRSKAGLVPFVLLCCGILWRWFALHEWEDLLSSTLALRVRCLAYLLSVFWYIFVLNFVLLPKPSALFVFPLFLILFPPCHCGISSKASGPAEKLVFLRLLLPLQGLVCNFLLYEKKSLGLWAFAWAFRSVLLT